MNESGWLFSFSRINQAHGDGTRSQSAHRNIKKVTNENIIRLDPFRETIQKNFQIVFSFLFFSFERRSIGINLCRCHSWLSWRQILQQKSLLLDSKPEFPRGKENSDAFCGTSVQSLLKLNQLQTFAQSLTFDYSWHHMIMCVLNLFDYKIKIITLLQKVMNHDFI